MTFENMPCRKGDSDVDEPALPEPGRNCPSCPRLVALRQQWRQNEPSWHNAPVPTFGSLDARLLIVGLAPGLRGANRTGRPFTGDYAGELLYNTLISFGFAKGAYLAAPDDGLSLIDTAVTNAVRCLPPENKPRTEEIRSCRRYLVATIETMPELRAIVALGRVAHDSLATALGLRRATVPFAHGATHIISPTLTLFDSYHCSRYNTNTGVLTEAMFRSVFAAVRAHL